MFKETAIEKLIEYIRALPEGDQKIIVSKIGMSKKETKKATQKSSNRKVEEFLIYTQKLPTRLPQNFKFDREEANER
jgi:hypothetical protein